MNKLEQLPEETPATPEIIGRPPAWTVLYGSGLILLVIVLLLFFSYLVKLPDLISGPITLSKATPAKIITAGQQGACIPLVKEGEQVHKGTPLFFIVKGPDDSLAIESPAAGKISFLYKKAQVKAGDKLAALVATDSTTMSGKMLITPEKLGRVKIGQQVNVSLSSYPSLQYGVFTGGITAISLIPDGSDYIVTVAFPADRKNQNNINFSAYAWLEGKAQIVTGQKRLIERIFSRFR